MRVGLLTLLLSLPCSTALADVQPPGRVRVTTTGQPEGTLHLRESSGKFRPVCTLPCSVDLPAGAELRLDGAGVRPTAPFRLMDGRSVVVHVEPSRTSTFVLGLAISGAGAALALSGPFAYLFVRLSGIGTDGANFAPYGYVALVGLGLLGVGLPTTFGSFRSHVEQRSSGPSSTAFVGLRESEGVGRRWLLPVASFTF